MLACLPPMPIALALTGWRGTARRGVWWLPGAAGRRDKKARRETDHVDAIFRRSMQGDQCPARHLFHLREVVAEIDPDLMAVKNRHGDPARGHAAHRQVPESCF